MSDYINYIDFNATKLGGLAYEIGDYKCAFENYTKALNKLREYQGDRMQPIMMASRLAEKKEETAKKLSKGKAVLNFEVWKLSKSSFVKGTQCVKYLYLDKFKKEKRKPVSKEKQILYDQGHSFEDNFRNTEFPAGINIKEVVGNFAYFNSYTKYLLKKPERQTLYEATIIEDEVLVMCDVLIKTEEGQIDIYEVKLNSEINEAIFNDLAVQYFVCKKRFGERLNSFNLVLRAENSEPNRKILNLKSELEKQIENVNVKIQEYKQVLKNKEPVLFTGEHCNKPYECEFIDYCKNKS